MQCENGSWQVTCIPPEIKHFSVSGYELLPRWINGRVGLEVDHALATELRDICGRIAELIDLFAKADKILDHTLEKTLGRAAIGLPPALDD